MPMLLAHPTEANAAQKAPNTVNQAFLPPSGGGVTVVAFDSSEISCDFSSSEAEVGGAL